MSETEKRVPELRFKGFVEDWEQRKLETLVDRIKSYSLSREVESVEYTGYKYIHYGDIHTKVANIIEESSTLPNIRVGNYDLLNKGDLVLADASEDYQGIAMPAIVTMSPSYNLVAGLHTIALRPIFADSMFLYYLIHSPIFRKYGYKIGTGMKVFGISVTNILKFESKFPSVNEQKKIGKLLKKMDETIALHQRKIVHLVKLKQSYLIKMFPQPGLIVSQLRFIKFSESWETRKLGSSVTFLNGRAFKQQELLAGGKYRVLRVGNFNTNDRWYYSNLELENNKYAEKGDLLYLWATNFGPEIWNEERVIYHYHIWKLEIHDVQIDKQYLFTWLKNDKERIKQTTNGTTMVHITKGNIEQREFKFPKNKIEQKKIGIFFNQLDSIINLHQLKVEKILSMKQVLLNKMFI